MWYVKILTKQILKEKKCLQISWVYFDATNWNDYNNDYNIQL